VHVRAATVYPKSFVVAMSSATMEPTLHCGRKATNRGCLARTSDRLRIHRLATVPQRGDIVLVVMPRAACHGPAGAKFVKRVIGVPGDTLEQRVLLGKAFLFRNGHAVPEPYVASADRDSRAFARFTVPKGQYFLMGDNRAHSCDSRSWGTVGRAALIGTVVKIIRYG
jgi:signal peptidase I